MRPLVASLPLIAALVWTGALIEDADVFGAPGTLLVGVGLLATATVSVVGMVVSGGRWAHRLALVGIGMTLIVAFFRPVDTLWMIGLITSALAIPALFSPTVTSRIRRLPAAAGPPPAAVAIPSLALTAPFLIGISLGEGSAWAGLIVGLSALLAAFLFARVVPGGLVAVRVVWPGLALGLSPFLELPAGVVAGLLAVAVAVLAWRSDVKASFHPPTEAGTAYPIPPELAPEEILDAAQLDDKGRRR